MLKSQSPYVSCAAALILSLALMPSLARAQAVVDPTRAEFDPSPDHDGENTDGSDIVSSYQLEVYYVGASQPMQTSPLGKPDPDPDGVIRVNLATTLVPLPLGGIDYVASVAAVGPGGTARSTMSNTFSFGSTCTFIVSPASQSFGTGSGTGSVSVTTSAGCAWLASSNVGWITITSGVSGSGSGTVNYSVSANTSASARSGVLSVAGEDVTITQSGASCSYSVSPTSQNFGSNGGNGSANLTTTSGCSWNATDNQSWITITSGGSGSGNGTISYSVSANTSSSQRSGIITVGGQTISITQSGQACSYSLSPSSQSFGPNGGTGSASLTTGNGCNWTASDNQSWISITSGSSGSGNGTVSYSVSANTGSSSRTGTITAGGQSLSITQSGQSCSYTISPTSQSFGPSGGTASASVTTSNGCSWTASDNRSWITILSGSSGSGNGTVTYRVSSRTATSTRTGTVTIAGQALSVSQGAEQTTLPSAPANLRVVSD